MAQTGHATLDKIYKELKAIRNELHRLEYAVIPVEKLSPEEYKTHMNDLKEAFKGQRVDSRRL